VNNPKTNILSEVTKKFSIILITLLLFLSLVFTLIPIKVSAADPGCYATSSSGSDVSVSPYNCPSSEYTSSVAAGNCYLFSAGSSGVATSGRQVDCSTVTVGSTPLPSSDSEDSQLNADCDPEPPEQLNRTNCGIINLLVIGINVLSALAGIAIVFSIMFAGFQYMTARDNSGQVQKAKQRIVWAIVALGLFIFMYALLDFLVPGGVI
jgi:hypothetical protein